MIGPRTSLKAIGASLPTPPSELEFAWRRRLAGASHEHCILRGLPGRYAVSRLPILFRIEFDTQHSNRRTVVIGSVRL